MAGPPAGDLLYRAEIQQKVVRPPRGRSGEEHPEWAAVRTRWCNFELLSGGETVHGAQVQPGHLWKFTFRNGAVNSTEQRILCLGDIYNIETLDDDRFSQTVTARQEPKTRK